MLVPAFNHRSSRHLSISEVPPHIGPSVPAITLESMQSVPGGRLRSRWEPVRLASILIESRVYLNNNVISY